MAHFAECSACHCHKMCLYVEDIHETYPEAVQREYEERGYPSWDNICTDCLDETEEDLEKWHKAAESANSKRTAGPRIWLVEKRSIAALTVEKNERGSIDTFVKEAASKIASAFEDNYRMLDTMTYKLRDCVWVLEGTPYDLNSFAIKTFGLPDGKTEKTYKILRDKRPDVENFWDKLVDALEDETWTLEGAYS